MKKFFALFKFGGVCLLAVYAVGFWLYSFFSAMYFIAFVFNESMKLSGSTWEQSIRWLIHHPLIFVILAILTIPGLVILDWDDIKKKIERRRQKDLYLESRR